MASILRLKDIAKVWHIERTKEQVVALGGISMDVEQGEFLVFVGPSGCGKSTLLQIIAGLEKPESGTVDLSRSQTVRNKPEWCFKNSLVSLAHGSGKYRLWPGSEKRAKGPA